MSYFSDKAWSSKGLKPIFHCDAKPFALDTFASPNAKDTNMLVSFSLGNTNFRVTQRKTPDASQWDIGCVGYHTPIPCIGHVYFMFFVLISFAFGTQRKSSFQWNMGFIFISGNAWAPCLDNNLNVQVHANFKVHRLGDTKKKCLFPVDRVGITGQIFSPPPKSFFFGDNPLVISYIRVKPV